MAGFIDLHSHWVPGIDDGVRSVEEGLELLRALRGIGFDTVIATPHMRPGMFDNDKHEIEASYAAMSGTVTGSDGMPAVGLACEHFFDDVVFARITSNQGLPYPGGRAVLVEFSADQFPARLNDRLFDLRRLGMRPVIAHPERYSPVWKRPEAMEDLVDRGNVLLMDVGALAGKYGRAPRKTAEKLLEAGLYYAVCSDAHRPGDVDAVAEGIRLLGRIVGQEEARFLLVDGPKAVLDGKVDL